MPLVAVDERTSVRAAGSPADRVPLRLLVVLCLGFGLAAGFLETGLLLFRHFALNRLIWTSRDFVWMIPLSYAVFAVIPMMLVLVVAIAAPRVVTVPRVVFLFCTLGLTAFGVALLGVRVHPLACLLLAAGISTRIAHAANRHGGAFNRLTRTGTPILAAAALSIAVGMLGIRSILERSALGNLQSAASGSPNVLVIIWDTVRRINLSLYGYERPTTPNLERWAQRGVVFERAMATAPWTLPSHASMFTGRLAQELNTHWRTPLDDTYPTVAEQLRSRGYATVGIVANLGATSWESGLDRGFIRYRDFELTLETVLLNSAAGKALLKYNPLRKRAYRRTPVKDAQAVTDDFLKWSQENSSRPFFAFLNYFDAHDPYRAPQAQLSAFRTGRGDPDRYDAAIAYLDLELGRLLGELERSGVLRNTFVVLTSDHGEHFGEKGLKGHGNSLYAPVMAVPLVVWLPEDRQAGSRVRAAVSLRDLGSTVMAITTTHPHDLPGQSLARYWLDTLTTHRIDTLMAGLRKGIRSPPDEPVSRGNMSSLLAGDYYYIVNGDGAEELYHQIQDPNEEHNLASSASATEIITRFRQTLGRYLPAGWTQIVPTMLPLSFR